MRNTSIYEDIAKRTGGDIYVGVVGPVRSGKSTFIKRFMDAAVIPNIADEAERTRAQDELPQAAGGKTIMTTEPKFIPEKAVTVEVGSSHARVRMVDCVGYLVDGAEGVTEDGGARMVMTPWSEEAMPFEEAAEYGTRKVIAEHSTVAVLVTTDGTIGDIPRESYVPAEERCVAELKAAGVPFVIVLNSASPESEDAEGLALGLEEKYQSPVALISCAALDRADADQILSMLTFEFPVREIDVMIPDWTVTLPEEHRVRGAVISAVREIACGVSRLSDASAIKLTEDPECKMSASAYDVSLGDGRVMVRLTVDDALFYKVIGELTSFTASDRGELLGRLIELSDMQSEFEKFRGAIADVERCGYGIVMPSVSEMELDEPEPVKKDGAYGVRLRASAPSIHLIRANIETELSPIVGSESRSEELVGNLLSEFENDASRIWESNIFGKSLYDLVNEGLHAKLTNMPEDARGRLSEVLSRI
ncbi:MAG: stage IV sporulation protein A, partial [Clostridia bacterium]|nr:stage IV sporulation protein A [Clostridia bacterium]